MGRNNMKDKEPGLTTVSPSSWPESDFEADLGRLAGQLGVRAIPPVGGRKRGPGRRNTQVAFQEIRLRERNLEMEYVFSNGGATLAGTLTLAYSNSDPLGQVVELLLRYAEESFHEVRRSRD